MIVGKNADMEAKAQFSPTYIIPAVYTYAQVRSVARRIYRRIIAHPPVTKGEKDMCLRRN